MPLGAALAICRFPGRRVLILLANALLGLPPVVVGLALYLLLSRSGPLGVLGMLFTPAAHGDGADRPGAADRDRARRTARRPMLWRIRRRAPGRWRDAAARDPHLLAIARRRLVTAVLAGFGRTISEVGAILIVGGNIAGYTRTMTTAIVLETSEGDLSLALALGLVLIGISIAVSAAHSPRSSRPSEQ